MNTPRPTQPSLLNEKTAAVNGLWDVHLLSWFLNDSFALGSITSKTCKYFVDGECYQNYTSRYDSSECETVLGGYFFRGRCYYGAPQTQNCTADGHCLRRSSTYSNGTCLNIGGMYTDGYCYYMRFECSGYVVNGQCYRTVGAMLTCCRF